MTLAKKDNLPQAGVYKSSIIIPSTSFDSLGEQSHTWTHFELNYLPQPSVIQDLQCHLCLVTASKHLWNNLYLET